MRGNAWVVFALCVTVACMGCASVSPKVLDEIVRVPPGDWSIQGMNNDVSELSKGSSGKPFSRYFGLFEKNYRTSGIHKGLKILRTTLLLEGSEFVFEIQTDGDIESAHKAYGNNMQFEIILDPPPNLRIITTGSMDKALLLSRGKTGFLNVVIDGNDKAVSAKLDTNYKVEAKLAIEINGDKLRIHIPDSSIPQSVRNVWSDKMVNFTWKVCVGLAVPPLDPIPTDLPDIYYVPRIYCLFTGHCEYVGFSFMWSTTKEGVTQELHFPDGK